MKFRKNKKGLELVYLVFVIIGILALVFIIILLVRMKEAERFDEEACHQAVLLRGTMSEVTNSVELGKLIQQEATQSMSLNCRTKDVVISSSNPEVIKRTIADEMAAAWSMLGEGKINFFGRGWNDEMRCAFVTKITFTEEARDNFIGENGITDFSDYLKYEKISGKQITYDEFFAGSDEHLNYDTKTLEKQSIPPPETREISIEQDLKNSKNNPNEENFEVASIDPKAGKNYTIVYTLWQADVYWNFIAGAAASGTTLAATWYTSFKLREAILKAGFKGYEVKDASGKWVTVEPSKLNNVKWAVGKGFKYKKFDGQFLKGGQPLPLKQGKFLLRKVKPRTVTSRFSMGSAALITFAVEASGVVATLFAYAAGSEAIDSFRAEKYVGSIQLVEYSSDEIGELGCTDLDVVP